MGAPLFLLGLILLTLFSSERDREIMATKRETGRRGEREAEMFLNDKGLRTLECNWQCSHKEIDLIMDEDNVIHFVEVRTLTAPSLLKPYETVGIAKQRNLIRAASSYLAIKRVRKEVSFDIVSVLFNNGRAEIEYFPNAFSPRW